MQILCVEEGSVNLEDLENLQDGKVLVYKAGTKTPVMIEVPDKERLWTKEEYYRDLTAEVSARKVTLEQLLFALNEKDYKRAKEIITDRIDEARELMDYYSKKIKD